MPEHCAPTDKYSPFPCPVAAAVNMRGLRWMCRLLPWFSLGNMRTHRRNPRRSGRDGQRLDTSRMCWISHDLSSQTGAPGGTKRRRAYGKNDGGGGLPRPSRGTGGVGRTRIPPERRERAGSSEGDPSPSTKCLAGTPEAGGVEESVWCALFRLLHAPSPLPLGEASVVSPDRARCFRFVVAPRFALFPASGPPPIEGLLLPALTGAILGWACRAQNSAFFIPSFFPYDGLVLHPRLAHRVLLSLAFSACACLKQNSGILLPPSTPNDGCVVQPWWVHCLLTTSNIPALSRWEQNSAFFSPLSTPYIGRVGHPWCAHFLVWTLTIQGVARV